MVDNCAANCYNAMMLLIQSLTNRDVYSPAINPNTDYGATPLTIYVSFAVIKTLEFNNQGTISVTGMLKMVWNDPRLKWNAANYNNVSEILIPANQLWVPRLGQMNGVSESLLIFVDGETSAAVQSNGDVTASIVRQFDVSCQMDLTRFPFDTQSCSLTFQIYDVRVSTVGSVFYPLHNTAITDAYTQDGEVTLVSTKVTNGSYCFVNILACFTGFNVSMTYLRNPGYFTNSVIIPSILLTFSAAIMYLIPVDNVLKINSACSVMLAFNFLQQTMDRLLPVTTTTPYCAIAILTELGLGGYGVMCAVVILMVHSLQPRLAPCCVRVINKFSFLICHTPQSSVKVQTVAEDGTQLRHRNEQVMELLEQESDPLITLLRQLVQLNRERTQLRINQLYETHCEHELSRTWRTLDSLISFCLLCIYLSGALLAIFLFQYSTLP